MLVNIMVLLKMSAELFAEYELGFVMTHVDKSREEHDASFLSERVPALTRTTGFTVSYSLTGHYSHLILIVTHYCLHRAISHYCTFGSRSVAVVPLSHDRMLLDSLKSPACSRPTLCHDASETRPRGSRCHENCMLHDRYFTLES